MNFKETRLGLSLSADDSIRYTKIEWKENRIMGKNEEEKEYAKNVYWGIRDGNKAYKYWIRQYCVGKSNYLHCKPRICTNQADYSRS